MRESPELGKAKLALHNAKQTFDALEKKHRKRTAHISALKTELAQLELSMPALLEKLNRAQADLRAAREALRLLKRERKEAERHLYRGQLA